MRRWIACLTLLTACLGTPPVRADVRVIELDDGSRIRGEVVSIDDDRYTVRSSALGTVTLQASQIVSITRPGTVTSGGVPAAAAATDAGAAVQALQAGIAGDPELLAKIVGLRGDPQLQAVLADPEIMRAIRNLDLEALQANPKFIRLMNNPVVREIIGKVP